MATPKCPKCDGARFEMQSLPVKKARFNLNAVNCASCGCVVAVHEDVNVSFLLHRLAEKLGVKLEE